MWEWSNQINQPKTEEKKKTSLVAAYGDLVGETLEIYIPPQKDAEAPKPQKQISTISEKEMKTLVEKKIEELKLTKFELIEKPYHPQSWQNMQKILGEYQRSRIMFFKLLGYSGTAECRNAGLSEDDINLLKQGIAPENLNTHIKIPFDFDGHTSFDNLMLIKTHPTHNNLHRIFDMQITNNFLRLHKKIFIPYFEGKIYND